MVRSHPLNPAPRFRLQGWFCRPLLPLMLSGCRRSPLITLPGPRRRWPACVTLALFPNRIATRDVNFAHSRLF